MESDEKVVDKLGSVRAYGNIDDTTIATILLQ